MVDAETVDVERSHMSDRFTPSQFLGLIRDGVQERVADGSLRRYVVSAIDVDGDVFVSEVGTGEAHDASYAVLDIAVPVAVGDYVIVGEIMGRGAEGSATRMVLGKRGANSPAVVTDAFNQQASSTPSTSSVTTFANAITLALVLPVGTWTVSAQGSVLLSHNVNEGSFRMEIDGDFSTTHSLPMVTEERFGVAHAVEDIAGGRTINVRVQFRSNTAGTTSARNPSVQAIAVRTA
jgi:hypothetical protein